MTLDSLADDVVTGACLTAVLLVCYWGWCAVSGEYARRDDAARRERLHRKSGDRGKF